MTLETTVVYRGIEDLMARRPNAVPVYRRHKATGQAVCTVRLRGGGYKDLYLGRHGSPASDSEYHRVVGIVIANGGYYPLGTADFTVAEALVAYTKFITSYYVRPDGQQTGTADDIKITLRYLKKLFASLPLADFGIPQLKAVRDAMVKDGRVRNQVNRRVSMVRSFFKWAVESQLVPGGVLAELKAVRALAAGRSGAREGDVRQPADPVAVNKVLPSLPPVPRAVVSLLRLTGARPTEILNLRPADLDRSKAVWTLAPLLHKGQWRGKARVVPIGPEGQAVLSPWLDGIGSEEFVFTAVQSERQRGREHRSPARPYCARLLAQALRRACKKAGVTRFSPYQLRHLKAVELRERYGLEYVRAVLGHSFAGMSDHYSRAADATLANQAAAEVG